MFTRNTSALLGLLLASAAQATTFDIHTDFSTASNPNGVWSYGYSTTLGGTLNLYDQSLVDGSGLQIWRSTVVQSLGAPADWNNPTNNPVGVTPAQTAAFHPGPGGEYSVYRFTAPSTDIFDLLASFGAIDSGGTDVHILDNGASIFSHAVDPSPSNALVSFSTPLSLTAGDMIDFAVGWGANQNFFSDSTSIVASLTSGAADGGGTGVPEPASLALLGIGLAGMAAARRRKAA